MTNPVLFGCTFPVRPNFYTAAMHYTKPGCSVSINSVTIKCITILRYTAVLVFQGQGDFVLCFWSPLDLGERI